MCKTVVVCPPRVGDACFLPSSANAGGLHSDPASVRRLRVASRGSGGRVSKGSGAGAECHSGGKKASGPKEEEESYCNDAWMPPAPRAETPVLNLPSRDGPSEPLRASLAALWSIKAGQELSMPAEREPEKLPGPFRSPGRQLRTRPALRETPWASSRPSCARCQSALSTSLKCRTPWAGGATRSGAPPAPPS